MPCIWAIGNRSPVTPDLLSYGGLFIKTGSFAPWKWFMGEWFQHQTILMNYIDPNQSLLSHSLCYWLWQFTFSSLTVLRMHTSSPHRRRHRQFCESRLATLESSKKDSRSTSTLLPFTLTTECADTEAIKDLKTWMFFLHARSQEMVIGVTNQYSLIINVFGF
jgi:hypothetical protein